MNAFECYQIYQAIRLHFRSANYNYFKYAGRTRCSPKSFLTHRNKYHFEKYARNFSRDNIILFFASNFFYDDDHKVWIGNMDKDVYLGVKSKKEGFQYHFEVQLDNLGSLVSGKSFEDVFMVPKNGGYPTFLQSVFGGKFSLEALILLDKLIWICDYYDNHLDDPVVWPHLSNKLRKFSPFFLQGIYPLESVIKPVLHRFLVSMGWNVHDTK